MLEWTGERFLPWLREATIAYEHLQRYAYAATFVKGKRVLDLASGEGYGSRILANSASSVVGVDFDEFRQLLACHFKNLRFLGQRILPSSSIWPIGVTGAGFEEFVMERGETEFRFVGNEKRIPVYFIAVASNSSEPLPQPGSVLLDYSNSLVQEKNEEIQ